MSNVASTTRTLYNFFKSDMRICLGEESALATCKIQAVGLQMGIRGAGKKMEVTIAHGDEKLEKHEF